MFCRMESCCTWGVQTSSLILMAASSSTLLLGMRVESSSAQPPTLLATPPGGSSSQFMVTPSQKTKNHFKRCKKTPSCTWIMIHYPWFWFAGFTDSVHTRWFAVCVYSASQIQRWTCWKLCRADQNVSDWGGGCHPAMWGPQCPPTYRQLGQGEATYLPILS